MANFRVNPVSKIDRGGSGRELDDVSCRGEDVNLLLEDVRLHRFDEFFGVRDLVSPLHQLPQPRHLGVGARVGLAALLVSPMGSDAVLRDAVHLTATDLNLDDVALWPDHRRMEGLVHAVLGRRDVIVELTRQRMPLRVDNAKRPVAVLAIADEHANPDDVVDFVEIAALHVHLAVDGVDVLGSTGDLRLYPRITQGLQKLPLD